MNLQVFILLIQQKDDSDSPNVKLPYIILSLCLWINSLLALNSI